MYMADVTDTAGKAKDRTKVWDEGKEKVSAKERCLQKESGIGRE